MAWTRLALFALSSACADEGDGPLAPVEAEQLVMATEAELIELSEVAADPYLDELIGSLDSESETDLRTAMASFGASVSSNPGQSYQRFQSALQAPDIAPPEKSDVALVHEALDVYRVWSEVTIYGTQN